MAPLATLAPKSAEDKPSGRGFRLMAEVAIFTIPTHLMQGMFRQEEDDPYFGPSELAIPPIFLGFLATVGGSLWEIWGKNRYGTGTTLAVVFRDGGAVPEAITAVISLITILAVSSFVLYFACVLHPQNVPTWERRGPGSRLLYVNGFISGLEIISSATLLGLLNSVPDSAMELGLRPHMLYAVAPLGLVQGGMSLVGFVLMVAGPSPFRRPKSYKPISKAADNPSRPAADSAEGGTQTNQGISQAAETQTLATLYQAQRQQRQELMKHTQRKFKVG